jgi:hypothetical protein
MLAVAPPVQASDRMTPGQWEFSLTSEGATHTSSHCVTKNEADAVNGSAKSAREHSDLNAIRGHCTVESFDVQADTVSSSLVCGPRQIASVATYHGDTFEGALTTTYEGKSVKTEVKARRLGVCK